MPVLPPHIPTLRILRNIPATLRQPVAVFTEYQRAYGTDFTLSLGKWRTTHFTSDAEIIDHVLRRNHRNYEKSEIQTDQLVRYLGRGLLTNTGADWLRQRRLIQPGFHRRRLDALTREMQSVIDEQMDRLAPLRGTGRSFDLAHFCRDTVFRIIVRAIFTDGFSREEADYLARVLDEVQTHMIRPIRIPALAGPLRLLGIERKYRKKAAGIRALIGERIRERRAAAPQDDLLQMLLDSRYADSGAAMTDEQLIDEIIILFAAGHETSANALSWAVWLLLRHPGVLDRARREVAAAAAAGPLDLEGAGRLTYLTQIIEETMRRYPPAWITDRVALTDDQAGGYDIPAGTVVGLFLYGLHHHPDYWTDPHTFDPDRMAPAAKKARPSTYFLPFGAGPRLCVGNHFALLEMQLFLAALLRRYSLRLADPTAEVGLLPLITLQMDTPVRVLVED